MHKLDPKYSRKLVPGTVVVWWGRRAFFEIIAETAEAIFRTWIIVSVFVWIDRAFNLSHAEWGFGQDAPNGFGYWLGVTIFCILACQRGILEWVDWWHEIIIVTRDSVNGGGRIDKFKGWFRHTHISEAITPQSPTVIFDQDWFYTVWGYLTGEQMARITMKSVTNTFIEGRKISPELERSISIIRGKPAQKRELSPGDLAMLSDIKQAMIDGLIEEYKAKAAADVLLNRSVFGE